MIKRILIVIFFIFSISHVGNAAAVAVTASELKEKYTNGEKIRVLIVPGHDDEFSGTAFAGVKEVEKNRLVAEALVNYLEKDGHYEVMYAHDMQNEIGDGNPGYASFLKEYFEENEKEIMKFRNDHAKMMKREVRRGNIEMIEGVTHAKATTTSVTRLYGINKWTNENNIDLVVHVHFNDYGSRTWNAAGEYTGFSIYVPDAQFDNGQASHPVADAIYQSLKKVAYPSNMTGEADYSGPIRDQELIAVGANNTLQVPSILIEYSYIYEPVLQTNFFTDAADIFAYRTYIGLNTFFKNFETASALPPYEWRKDMKENIKSDATLDIFMLQLALRLDGSYPAEGKDQADCPITGIFGSCTKAALKLFQTKYGISPTGFAGPQTRAFLNALY